MRSLILVVLLAALATIVSAWTKEDHEIFDLVSALEASEGKKTTFYSWLDVPHTASTNEIAKAYRKKSMLLHPDKNPGVKGIHERFARLGVISTILRNKESRDRYDFFYKNGVPVWRGTGYYYSRFRPGLGSVLVFLAILTTCLHYLIQRLNYKRDKARVEKVMQAARVAAWGPKLIAIEGRRKVRVPLGGPRRLDEDGNLVEGRSIDMIVEGSHVYILESSGELHPLDTDAATPPSFKATWLPVLLTWLYRKVAGGVGPSSAPQDGSSASDDEESSASEVGGRVGVAADAPRGSRGTAVKAGGRRRNAGRKR